MYQAGHVDRAIGRDGNPIAFACIFECVETDGVYAARPGHGLRPVHALLLARHASLEELRRGAILASARCALCLPMPGLVAPDLCAQSDACGVLFSKFLQGLWRFLIVLWSQG